MAKAKPKDPTILQKPVILAKNGVQQIFDCFRYGTTDLKMLLQHEVDIIYECRICRSLFRGLPNFIDHKKSYCTDRISIAKDLSSSNPNKDVQNIFRKVSEEMPQLELEVSEGAEPKAKTAEDAQRSNVSRDSEPPPKTDCMLVFKPIQSTSKAVYQHLMKPKSSDLRERILTAKQKMTSPNKSPPTRITTVIGSGPLDTSGLIEEISARRAAHSGVVVVQPESPDKKYDTRSVAKTEIKTIKTIFKPKGVVKSKQDVKKKVLGNKNNTSRAKSFAATRIQNLKPFSGPNPNHPMCVLCKKICKNRTSLAWHMRVHSKHLYKCTTCSYFNYSPEYLKQHLRVRHDATDAEIQQVLSNRITTNKELDIKSDKEVAAYTILVKESHKVAQTSPTTSPKAETKTEEEKSGDLKVKDEPRDKKDERITEQTGDSATGSKTSPSLQLHKCSMCEKTFASRRNLARHEKQHTNQGSDKEEDAETKQDSKVMKSVSSKILETRKAQAAVEALIDAKAMKCQKCNKRLFNIYSLRHHVRNHFGYNSYKCKFCAFKTTDYSNLKRHLARKHAKKFHSAEHIKSAIRSMKSGVWLSYSGSNSSLNKTGTSETTTASSSEVKKESPSSQPMQTTSTSPAASSTKSSPGSSPRTLIRLERIPVAAKTDKVEPPSKSGSGYVNPVKMAAIAMIINEKLLRCLRCKKQFDNIQLLKKHAARHLGYNTFKCKFCAFVSHSYSWFKRHLTQNHSRKIKTEEQLSKLMSEMRAVQY
ncbi:zinc finger protein 800-like [Ptychodera flava]|uniref:zinc finger protein 800-like n=1 Tax=Ptychodera flava TaxID=63121 RepID=UPI00396A4AE1